MYKSIRARRFFLIGLALSLLCTTPCIWGAGVKDVIAAQNKKFEDAFARRDAAAIADQYATDAECFYDGQDIIRGKQAIEDAWKKMFGAPGEKIRVQTIRVEEHKDWAVETGKGLVTDAAGKVTFDGKYLVIWKLQHGEWKIYRDIANSNRPRS